MVIPYVELRALETKGALVAIHCEAPKQGQAQIALFKSQTQLPLRNHKPS